MSKTLSGLALAPILALGLFAAVPAAAQAPQAAPAALPSTIHDCHIGAYRLADGRLVDVGPTTDGHLRWRAWDGTSGLLTRADADRWTSTLGWTGKPDGKTLVFSTCPGGSVDFAGVAGRRIPLDQADTTFAGQGGTPLAGRLVLPKGTGPVPIVILTHGSETYSGRDIYPFQRILPAEGVGVFVYDKRGTGQSKGQFTEDFSQLADDAVAALKEARRMAGARAGRVGFQGGSQGGWIAPLAASRVHADFVIVGFGLAVSPADEDREEVVLDMQLKGWKPADIAQALKIQDATTAIMASGFTTGFAELEALKAKDRDQPWYKDVGGDYTPLMLKMSEADMRAKGPELLMGLPLKYDPMPVLKALKTPQIWILAADDVDAPSAETARRLRTLIRAGRPVTLAVYPATEHGIYEYVVDETGERKSTRNAEGYFRMTRDFARDGRLSGTYGRSTVEGPGR